MIEFELCNDEAESEIDSYSLGHITLTFKNAKISSKHSNLDQSVMIFIAVADLLDGYRMFVDDKNATEYNFVGCDSSFQFYLTKKPANYLIIKNRKKEIVTELERQVFVNSLYRASKSFIDRYYRFLDDNEIIKKDLIDALDDFTKKFDLK